MTCEHIAQQRARPTHFEPPETLPNRPVAPPRRTATPYTEGPLTMTISIPAAGLIATGLCTGACLLAFDDDCDCRCGGRFHGRLVEAPVAVETNWRPHHPESTSADPTDRTFLGDILAVLGTTERMHSDELCVLLGEEWPGDYSGWTPATFARALLQVGLRTQQINKRTEDGGQINRRGVRLVDIRAAARKANRLAG